MLLLCTYINSSKLDVSIYSTSFYSNVSMSLLYSLWVSLLLLLLFILRTYLFETWIIAVPGISTILMQFIAEILQIEYRVYDLSELCIIMLNEVLSCRLIVLKNDAFYETTRIFETSFMYLVIKENISFYLSTSISIS